MKAKPEQPKREGRWYELQLAPATLMKMVIAGKAKVIGKDAHKCLIYRLL